MFFLRGSESGEVKRAADADAALTLVILIIVVNLSGAVEERERLLLQSEWEGPPVGCWIVGSLKKNSENRCSRSSKAKRDQRVVGDHHSSRVEDEAGKQQHQEVVVVVLKIEEESDLLKRS